MATDLRQGRLLAGVTALQWLWRTKGARITADPDDQHAISPQVQGRADGSRLTHRAVAEIFRADPDRREQQGSSEEHTSELQSLMRIAYAVFCLKKKNKIKR